MAGNEVDIKITGDDRQILMMWQRQYAEITKNQYKLEQLARTSHRASKNVSKDIKQSTDSVMAFGKGLIGVGAVVSGIMKVGQLINAEHKDLMRRNKENQVVSRTFGEQMRRTRIAFTPDDTLRNEQLEGEVQRIAKATQTDANMIGDSLTDAFSAKGPLSNRQAIEATEAAFSLMPNDLEGGKTLASRAMDIATSNKTGVQDMKVIVGFMQNIQNAARITTLEKVGRNLVPAMTAIQQAGDTPEQAAEIVVTLTKLMQDAKGELTKTAAINLGTRLKGFVPEADKKGKFRGDDAHGEFDIPKEQIDAFAGAKSTAERIAVLQKSPELRREFIDKNPFAAESRDFVGMLLEGGKQAQAQYSATQKAINPLDANQRGAYDQKLADIQKGKFQAQVNAKERSDANLMDFQLSDRTGQDVAAAEEVLSKAMSQVGLTERTIKGLDFSWLRGDSPAEYASKIIDETINDLRGKRGGYGNVPVNLDVDTKIKYLESQQKVLDELAEKQQEARQKTKRAVAPQEGVVDVRKLLNVALEGRSNRARLSTIFNETRNAVDPASTAIGLLRPEMEAYQDLKDRGKLSEPQAKVFDRLQSVMEKLQAESKQSQERAIKAMEDNTSALRENNRLREKEQRTPTVAAPPPRSREPFRVPAEKLSRGD